jgi:hypothetical protein
MKYLKIPLLIVSFFLFVTVASAQRTEITISFSEQFFDALLDAVFQHAAPPEFSLSSSETRQAAPKYARVGNAFAPAPACNESIKLMRESGNTRTAVRFREGKIIAPIAFSGNYNPPFIGCVPFAGIAEAIVELEFDQQNQRLIARAKVRDVSLNGAGGIGGSLVARMVQGSIDKKINPIEIIRTDKVSFVLPLQNSNGVRMKAIGFAHGIVDGQLNIRVMYEFLKV